MWARVSVYENDAEAASRFEAGLKLFREKLLPLARQNPGWVATFNLATADRDRSITISLWHSRQEMIASERAAAQARTATGHVGRDSGVSVEHYEMTLAEYREEAVAVASGLSRPHPPTRPRNQRPPQTVLW